MERVVITRLRLSDNRSLEIRDPWPADVLVPNEKGEPTKVPQSAKVGAIFFVQAATSSESWVEEEIDEDVEPPKKRLVTNTRSFQTPSHYEVWAVPLQGSLLEQTNETRCLRIPRELVLEAEEAWPLVHALKLIDSRREETEIPADTDEPEPEARPNGAAASA